ncbi:MAG TPA: hypothetical protein VFR80_03760 [Pyrinomonadaceae bacterium]|nr:hypothetical protein [Pyrinomonadaceae bacterium]
MYSWLALYAGTKSICFASKVIFQRGFAVRCAAAALPRRKLGYLMLGYALASKCVNAFRGVAHFNLFSRAAGQAAPPHIWRQSRNHAGTLLTQAHYFCDKAKAITNYTDSVPGRRVVGTGSFKFV